MKIQPELAGREGDYLLIRIPAGAWVLIEAIRKLPGRRWDKNEKIWRVPKSPALRAFFQDFGLTEIDLDALGKDTANDPSPRPEASTQHYALKKIEPYLKAICPKHSQPIASHCPYIRKTPAKCGYMCPFPCCRPIYL